VCVCVCIWVGDTGFSRPIACVLVRDFGYEVVEGISRVVIDKRSQDGWHPGPLGGTNLCCGEFNWL